LLSRPTAGSGSIGIEIRDVQHAYGGTIMIAHDTKMIVTAQQLDTLTGIGAVADNIP
jgi:hypothetical protein